MEHPIQTSGSFFRSLTIIYWALFIGQLAFASITLVITLKFPVKYGEFHPNDIFSYLVPALLFGGFLGSHYMSKMAMQKAAQKETFRQKLDAYKGGFIIRYALIEGPNLFCIVAYLLSSNLIFMYLSVTAFVFYLISAPKKDRIGTELELNATEMDQLNDPNFEIL